MQNTNDIPKGPLQRVAAIHDISGFGKCSMTVVLPILSAAGIEVVCMPTAVLSTHTGGFEGFTYRDLTEDLPAITEHWKSLDLHFSSIYSGFLGSPEQVDIVSNFMDTFNSDNTLVYVDPVMADEGELYSVFDDHMVDKMRELCEKADLLLPNITEACFLLKQPYQHGPYTRDYIEKLVRGLSDMGPKKVVLTGVYFDNEKLGAACYDRAEDKVEYAFSAKVPGQFHGTGDIFGSFCLAALLNGKSLLDSTQFAVDLTTDCILRTVARETNRREGVDFEGVLPEMMKRLELV
ncbi:pyridoxamine kinase [Eubacterium limosum]|uniref:pyridoxal kinase n=1 Tax=Eubacterium limosum TaxID=1736 RepID=A0ABT5URG7_EUBLI|nr:pyridoxamine kinase [Eubacterium limosum]MCB6568106.1 pyridoxamine kinase [Eubacterium limosum]MDE1470107.1 pyridoxamine kinase [Eubacterium limosum]